MSFDGSMTVCVTGAGGFIGSWLVNLLLQKDYTVRATVRNPEDPKNRHLKKLPGAEEKLTLWRADVLHRAGLAEAINGCDGVFHTASPVTNDQDKIVVAVEGTKNVLNIAADAAVRRVVLTSSYGAVHMNPHRSPEDTVDEGCWSDLDFCRKTNNWYCYAKMMAEQAAWEIAEERGLNLMVVVPPVTFGPMLQPMLNDSGLHLAKYLSGRKKAFPNAVQGYVHVKDIAAAHILVYETPSAGGRYLCIAEVLHRADLIGLLNEMFPQYPITNRCEDELSLRVKPYKFSNQRLIDLGLKFIPVKQAIYEMVVSLVENGHLPLIPSKI
ncbi:unnamed protein product [Spirodela intermedia]|uniref:NAD-dependent epimerase/dehydratase domain-containing protein n=1 Tax=Spirodela intermedia TaxID=51605 RepID=A0A7I8JBN7_SPIIN|nr:unnamed protein product [Spirodela intermedia]CAA6666882.1 unnamed protein product [Spirodela intermedia]